jgi:hypothetical protein
MPSAFQFLLFRFFCVGLLFSPAVMADNDLPTPTTARGDSAAGTLRNIGKYVGDNGRYGQTITQLADGSIFVYGAVPNNAVEKDAVILDPRQRIYAAAYVMPGAISWDPIKHGWISRGRAPECPHTAYTHTATLLTDNKILFAGGLCDTPRLHNDDSPLPAAAFNKVSLWNQASQKWESVPSLAQGRLYHSASLLADGSVMIIGGEDDRRTSDKVEPVLASVELFRDATKDHAAEILPLAPLQGARAKHTSTRMSDNSVMVVGGINSASHPLASAEIFDPKTLVWRDGPALNTARSQHSAVLLDDGRLMIAGGIGPTGRTISSVEIYDPATNSWAEAARLLVPLLKHSAAKLSNGDVLIAGISTDVNKSTVPRSMLWKKAIEQWQPAGILRADGVSHSGGTEDYRVVAGKDGGALVFGDREILQWLPAQRGAADYFPNTSRTFHATVLLPDNRILLAGGRTGENATTLSELYDPVTNKFTVTGPMQQARYTGMPYQASLSSIVLKDGRVIVAGGWVVAPGDPENPVANSPDIWDPATGLWSVIKTIRFEVNDRVSFNTMKDGRVLFFASREQEEKGTSEFRAWIWNPDSNQVQTPKVNATASSNVGIAVLGDGRVLIVGSRQLNAKAELWDSRSGVSLPLTYPDGLRGKHLQTLLLKNGDVLVLSADYASLRANPQPESPMLWSARTKTFTALPPLATDINWPMTELNDGSLIAWAQENINPASAQRLRPGAEVWEPIPRFPQTKATVTLLPSGQLLALASSSPHVAIFGEQSPQWQLKQSTYLHTENPALVELPDGALAVVGTVLGNKIAVQTWNSKTNTWTMTRAIQGNRGSTGKAVRLSSGAVMTFSFGGSGRLLCDIWRPSDDSWKVCGSFTSENKDTYPDFVLGKMEDGRVAFMANSETTSVYDEAADKWQTMKIEWNTDGLRYGEAVRSDKPLARFFDSEKNLWLDANEAGGRYFSTIQAGYSTPALLWDRTKKRWAYISLSTMGKNAVFLPDGCAISGLPFKIFNPNTGKVTELSEPVTGLDYATMTVLADGTVVVVGKNQTAGEMGSGFFHRKASCAGFETHPGDDAFMPGVLASARAAAIAAPAPTSAPASSKGASVWTQLVSFYYAYRWLALAIFIPFALYLILSKGIQWLRNKFPASALTKPIGGSLPSFAAFSLVRVIVYGLALIIAVPMLWNYMNFRSAGITEKCEASPASSDSKLPRSQQIAGCINKDSGFFGRLFSSAKSPSATFPCRYIGIWSSSRNGVASRVTLQANGQYIFEENSMLKVSRPPVLGHWEIQGDNMVWHHKNREDHPDINKILKQTESSFTLVEENGGNTEFELIKSLKPEGCTR